MSTQLVSSSLPPFHPSAPVSTSQSTQNSSSALVAHSFKEVGKSDEDHQIKVEEQNLLESLDQTQKRQVRDQLIKGLRDVVNFLQPGS